MLIFENTTEGEGEPTHWLMIGAVEEGQERPQARPEQRVAGDAPAKPAARPQERGNGWRGPSAYRRPGGALGSRRGPEPDEGDLLLDDSLEDLGRR